MLKKTLWLVVFASVFTMLVGSLLLVELGRRHFVDSRPAVTPVKVTSQATEAERIAAVSQWLDQQFSNHRFNGGVLVVRGDEVLLSKTCGFTDHTAKTRLDEHSSFRLASVSKQFTAAGVLRLAEMGKLSLDDPLSKHFEGFFTDEVTIRHLLNQTSGIGDAYMRLGRKHRDDIGDVLSIQEVVELLAKYGEQEFEPGSKMQYSNTNYVLLAGIIESASGTSFERFMQQELFVPLGMKDTRVWNLLSKDRSANQSSDFKQFNASRTELSPTWIDGVAGDGAVFCSLHDFVIWHRFWNGNAIVSSDLLGEALSPVELSGGSVSNYGFGWIVEEDRHWHNGSWLGARTFIARYPESDCCFVVLDNSSNGDLDKIVKHIEKTLGPVFLDLYSPEAAKRLVADGNYAKVAPFTGVRWENGRPTIEIEGSWYPLLAVDDHPIEKVMQFANDEFGSKAKKRFAEDFVETLAKMGHNPNWHVTLTVRKADGSTEEKITLLTSENRNEVRRND